MLSHILMKNKRYLGDRLLIVLGIWSSDGDTVIDTEGSESDRSSGSGDEESSIGELLDSSVSSTSRGGKGNGKNGDFGKNAGKNVDNWVGGGWLWTRLFISRFNNEKAEVEAGVCVCELAK